MMVIARNPMQARSPPSRTVKPPFHGAGLATIVMFFRTLWRGGAPIAKGEQRDETGVLWDAHCSMRCGNPARSWRVLSEWLRSRSDQPEDYARLCARVLNWKERWVISRLTEARVARLLILRRSTEVLDVLAQIAARGGAQRISRILLSDFSARFPGDPRVSVSEALKRRLTQQAPAKMR